MAVPEDYPKPLRLTSRRYRLLDETEGPLIRSLSSRTHIHLNFINCTTVTIRVYWIDFDAHERLFGTIASGDAMWMNTFLTHPWIFESDSPDTVPNHFLRVDGDKMVYFPKAHGSEVLITVDASAPWTRHDHRRCFMPNAPQFCRAVRALLLTHHRSHSEGGRQRCIEDGRSDASLSPQTPPIAAAAAAAAIGEGCCSLPGGSTAGAVAAAAAADEAFSSSTMPMCATTSVSGWGSPGEHGEASPSHPARRRPCEAVLGDLPLDILLDVVPKLLPCPAAPAMEDMVLPSTPGWKVPPSLLLEARKILGEDYPLDHLHLHEYCYGPLRRLRSLAEQQEQQQAEDVLAAALQDGEGDANDEDDGADEGDQDAEFDEEVEEDQEVWEEEWVGEDGP